jgi:hypothetical protein
MDADLVKRANEQHALLMQYVEALIAKLYAEKDKNDHLNIWYTVTALEIYKLQATIFFKLLVGQQHDQSLMELCADTREKLADQLNTIGEFVATLLPSPKVDSSNSEDASEG